MPEIQSRRLDLLGITPDGELLHIELQSTNDPSMPLRMAEYCLAIFRHKKRIPRQFVVYVGREPLTIPPSLSGHGLSFSYELIDMRNVDGEGLLASPHLSDNVIGLLCNVADPVAALPRVISRIAEQEVDGRLTYLRSLLLVSGLRGWAHEVELEASTVPILIDIMENEVLGREFKRGLEKGRQLGLAAGEGVLLRRQLEKRFGPLPKWAEQRLSRASTTQLENWGVGLLEAKSLDDLLRARRRR